MKIVDGITKHTICVCVDKAERGIMMQSILNKMGYRIVLANGMYDLLKSASQEMPHLIITESVLQDGNAGTIYDKIMQDPMLQKTPILVLVLKKTKEELSPVQGRKFAGMLLGHMEPSSLIAKVNELMTTTVMVSPYFVGVDELNIEDQFSISVEAVAVGRNEECVALKSKVLLDGTASVTCVPQDKRKSPAILKMATNLEIGSELVNLFPLSRVQGMGREWVAELPDLNKNMATKKKSTPRRILLYDANGDRAQEYKEVLSGYEIDVLTVSNGATFCSLLGREFEQLGCIFISELPEDTGWNAVYEKIPAKHRPPVVVATTAHGMKSSVYIRYLKKPFGLGILVEALESGFERGENFASNKPGGDNHAGSNGLSVAYEAPATLLGLDETGGVLQIRFPLLNGSKLHLNHPMLQKLWQNQTSVNVAATAPCPDAPDFWQVRFESVPAGTSKLKYWEKLAKELAQLKSKNAA